MRSKHIKISSESFDWAETLQTAAADESVDRIWLLGDTSTGVQGLCNALRQEDCASKIRFSTSHTFLCILTFRTTKFCKAISNFSVEIGSKISYRIVFRSCLSSEELSREELTSVIERDLVCNVLEKGVWGTYRHSHMTSSQGHVTSSQGHVTSHSAYVDTLTRGDLSSLSWIQAPDSPKSNDMITCEVCYRTPNFQRSFQSLIKTSVKSFKS